MNKKGKINEMMSRRTPLAQREVVEPVDMYTSRQVDKPIEPQVVEKTSSQVDKTTTPSEDKPESVHKYKKQKPHVEKYKTRLRPETIKAVKRAALESDRKDYEIVQAALDQYLQQ